MLDLDIPPMPSLDEFEKRLNSMGYGFDSFSMQQPQTPQTPGTAPVNRQSGFNEHEGFDTGYDAGMPGYEAPTPGSFSDKMSRGFQSGFGTLAELAGNPIGLAASSAMGNKVTPGQMFSSMLPIGLAKKPVGLAIDYMVDHISARSNPTDALASDITSGLTSGMMSGFNDYSRDVAKDVGIDPASVGLSGLSDPSMMGFDSLGVNEQGFGTKSPTDGFSFDLGFDPASFGRSFGLDSYSGFNSGFGVGDQGKGYSGGESALGGESSFGGDSSSGGGGTGNDGVGGGGPDGTSGGGGGPGDGPGSDGPGNW
jgi:hypothetical protein